MNFRSEDLIKRTKALALRIIKMYNTLPTRGAAVVLGNQVLRSGTSVGANYREAVRARSRAEFVAKMGDCLKELDETAYWLELMADGEIVPASKLTSLQDETNQLCAIFYTIIKTTRKNS